MKYPKTYTTLAILALGSGLAKAAVTISVVGRNGGPSTASQGTYASPLKVSDDDPSGTTIQHVISGLDLDGVGGANDQVTINLTATLTGSGSPSLFQVNKANGSNWIAVDDNFVGSGESVTIAFSSFELDLNGSSADASILSFDGFTQIDVGKQGAIVDGDQFVANGVTINGIADQNLYVLGDQTQSSLTLAYGNFDTRLNRFHYEITAVPEPSSTALLGLGGLALILRRRK